MTRDEGISHIEDRIRYWEGVLDDSRSGDYLMVRSLARKVGTTEGRGVRDLEKIRTALAVKAERRLVTLRAEQARLYRVAAKKADTHWG